MRISLSYKPFWVFPPFRVGYLIVLISYSINYSYYNQSQPDCSYYPDNYNPSYPPPPPLMSAQPVVNYSSDTFERLQSLLEAANPGYSRQQFSRNYPMNSFENSNWSSSRYSSNQTKLTQLTLALRFTSFPLFILFVPWSLSNRMTATVKHSQTFIHCCRIVQHPALVHIVPYGIKKKILKDWIYWSNFCSLYKGW